MGQVNLLRPLPLPPTRPKQAIKTNGLVLILKEHHEKLDTLVAEAYGWPENLSDGRTPS